MSKQKIISSLILASMLSGCAIVINDDPDNDRRYRSSSSTVVQPAPSASPASTSFLSYDQEADSYSLSAPLNTFYDYQLIKTGARLERPTPGGRPIPVRLNTMISDLANYDAIIIGEAHGHVGNHHLQLAVMQGLQEKGHKVTLSMEQFETDTQDIVDQYLAGSIGENILKKEARAWPHYSQSYRPLVEFAKYHKMPVIAAESPTSVVRCIGIEGPSVLTKLPQDISTQTAHDLDLSDGAYKDKFIKFLKSSNHGSHGTDQGTAPTEEELWRYAAQVNRDETMSWKIAERLSENPDRKIVHITGNFHSAGFLGTVERLKRRLPNAKIAVIHPVLVKDSNAPSFTKADLGAGNYLALLQPAPKMFVSMKNMMAFMKGTGQRMQNRTCDYSQ